MHMHAPDICASLCTYLQTLYGYACIWETCMHLGIVLHMHSLVNCSYT
jgi:hypothetical protein